MISFSRLCVLWALRMLCSELTEHKCCVSACEKCCKHPRGDHKKINGSGKSPLYLLLWVQQQSSQPIAAAWCSPANARERIVIQQHSPAGRQLIFKTATVRKPATLKLWKMSVLLSPDRMILFFNFFFLWLELEFLVLVWVIVPRIFLAGLDCYQCHIPKPGTSFVVRWSLNPSSPSLLSEEQYCTAWKELCPHPNPWTLILCNASEPSCQNPGAFLFQSSPDLIEIPGSVYGQQIPSAP